MPWSGGVFNRLNGATGWVDDANAFIGIEATRHDTQDNDFRDGINACLNRDGSNAATGNQNFANYRLTAVGVATARTDAPQAAQVQDGDFIWLGTTAGTSTAQTASATPAITAYKAGQKFRMQIGSGLGSTGSVATAHTININSIGAKNIVNNEDSTNPTLGTWVASALMELVYDGTNFRITNDPGGWLSYTVTVTPLSGTVSSVSSTYCRFKKQGKAVHVQMETTFTQNTGTTTLYTITLPVNIVSTATQTLYGMCTPGANTVLANIFNVSSATVFRVYPYDYGTFAIGAGRYIYVNAIYQSV